MNPQADDKSDRRKANEKPNERSDPIWNGVCRSGKIRYRGRRTILQDSFNVSFEQRRTGRFVGVVADYDRLALEVTHS